MRSGEGVTAGTLVKREMGEGLCPLQESARILGEKWGLIILVELYKSSDGFNNLKARVHGISSRILAKKLRKLQQFGLVERTEVNKSPLRVSYELTDRAKELEPMFETLHVWGLRHGLNQPPDPPHGQDPIEPTPHWNVGSE